VTGAARIRRQFDLRISLVCLDSHVAARTIGRCAHLRTIDQTRMESLRKTTHAVLALTPREAKVLRMRFGIDMGAEHTLEMSKDSSTSHGNASGSQGRRRFCPECSISS
jgi:hypothetical protein